MPFLQSILNLFFHSVVVKALRLHAASHTCYEALFSFGLGHAASLPKWKDRIFDWLNSTSRAVRIYRQTRLTDTFAAELARG